MKESKHPLVMIKYSSECLNESECFIKCGSNRQVLHYSNHKFSDKLTVPI